MAFGPAHNCTKCKLLVSQVMRLQNNDPYCVDCFQKEYDVLYVKHAVAAKEKADLEEEFTPLKENLEKALQQIIDFSKELDYTKKQLEKEHNELVQYKYLAMAAKMVAEAFERIKDLTEFEHD